MKAHKTLYKLWPDAGSVWNRLAYDAKDHLTDINLRLHLTEKDFNNTIASGCSKLALREVVQTRTTDQITSDTYMMEVLKNE